MEKEKKNSLIIMYLDPLNFYVGNPILSSARPRTQKTPASNIGELIGPERKNTNSKIKDN